MDHDIQLMFAPKDTDVTYQDPGYRHLLQNHPIQTEQVTHYHQMYRDYTVQEQSFSNSMAPQYAQTSHADTIQQQFNNREVHQEMVAPQHDDENGGKKEYICEFCLKVFIWKCRLEKHLLIHTGEKPNVCQVCSRRFNQKYALNRHGLTHTGEKPYVCTICKRAFAQKYNLTLHLMTHTGTTKLICEICKKCFTTEYYLYKHRYHQHSENTVFKHKKPNKITEVANKQEVPITGLGLKQTGVCMERPLHQSMKYLIQTAAEHCRATATDSKCFQEQVSITTAHLGATENTQSCVPIDQHLMHMVPQVLDIDTRGHPQITSYAAISCAVPYELRQVEHQTAARNGHPSLAYSGQAIDTINHTLTPEVNQNLKTVHKAIII